VSNPGQLRDDGSFGGFDVARDEVTCRQFVELLTDYFEGALAPQTLTHVEEHLVMCDWCVAYVDQMETTIDGLRSLPETPPPEPPADVLEVLRARRGRTR
jgi:predicted anti-sigma-YlaC factor YlaD